MTRGNLTYHFKDKSILLEAITERFWAGIEIERKKTRLLPSFENMHNEIQLFYSFQRKYAFIFLDHHVLNHPSIKKKFKTSAEDHIKEIEATIAFAISAGNMKKEDYEGMYKSLAFSTWMISFYWLNQQMLLGGKTNKSSEEGEMKIWSMLLPHLTDKGLKAFRKYFGDDYLKKLGSSLNTDIAEYVGF